MRRTDARAVLDAVLFEGSAMTGGETFYLAMAIGSFVAFAAVLAHQSWRQSRMSTEFPAGKPADAPQATAAQQGTAQHA